MEATPDTPDPAPSPKIEKSEVTDGFDEFKMEIKKEVAMEDMKPAAMEQETNNSATTVLPDALPSPPSDAVPVENGSVKDEVKIEAGISGDALPVSRPSETDSRPHSPRDYRTVYEDIVESEYRGGTGGRAQGYEKDMPCDCQYDPDDLDSACGESNECINRALYVECSSCPCRSYCQNKRFQKHQYAAVEVFDAGNKGFGIRATADIPAGAFVREYVGEVIPTHTFLKRTQQYAREGTEHFYFMSLTSNEVIDATRKGSISRFVNHSCDPNCQTQKWIVKGRYRIGIFTTKFIAKGEELSFDYQFQRYGQEAQPCYCGTAKCRGFIGGESSAELPEFEGLDIDEEDSDEETDRKPKGAKGPREGQRSLETKEDVMKLIRVLTRSSDARPSKVRKLLDKLEATTSIVAWREFLRFRGMMQLKAMLMDQDNFIRCCQVLRILKVVPIASRNSTSLVESEIESVISGFAENTDPLLRQLSSDILQAWQNLEVVYKIPKRVVTLTDGTPDETGTPGTPNEAGQKRNLDDAFGSAKENEWDSKKAKAEAEIIAPWANVQPDDRDRFHFIAPRDSPQEPVPQEPEQQQFQQPHYSEPVPGCPGWARVFDYVSMSFYFFNESTQETLWEPPAGALYYLEGNGASMYDDSAAVNGQEAGDGTLPPQNEAESRSQSSSREKEPSQSSSREKPPPEMTPEQAKKKLLSVFAEIVSKYLSKWKSEMDREQFKYLARKITETLVEKEAARHTNPSLKPSKETETKITKYISSYMERLKADPKYPANIKRASSKPGESNSK